MDAGKEPVCARVVGGIVVLEVSRESILSDAVAPCVYTNFRYCLEMRDLTTSTRKGRKKDVELLEAKCTALDGTPDQQNFIFRR